MEALDVAKKINLKIIELDKLKESLEGLAIEKANAAANYEKKLAMVTLRLSQGDSAISLIDKLSRGECADEKMAMDLAESRYKNQLKIIDLTEAQLNGYQSINRFLAEA